MSKRQRVRSDRGFTLIEIMIVLAIISTMVVFGFQKIDNKNNQIKAAVRKFSAIAKQLHSFAKLNASTYRLAFELGVGEKDTQYYWIEKASGPVIPSGADLSMSADQLGDLREAAEKEKSEGKPNTAPESTEGFTMDTKIFKDKKELPDGVRIVQVEIAGQDQAVKTGRAYIYFLPQGMTTEAIVQLTAGPKLNWSLITEPLTGRLDIVTEHMVMKDLRQ